MLDLERGSGLLASNRDAPQLERKRHTNGLLSLTERSRNDSEALECNLKYTARTGSIHCTRRQRPVREASGQSARGLIRRAKPRHEVPAAFRRQEMTFEP